MCPLPPELKKELQTEYIATFDEKLAELQKALAEQDTEKLKTLFHKLAGSGATYEFPEISECARRGENSTSNLQLCDSIVEELRTIFLKKLSPKKA